MEINKFSQLNPLPKLLRIWDGLIPGDHSTKTHRKLSSLLIVLLLPLLPVTLVLASQVTRLLTQADTSQALVFISPEAQSLPPESSFNLMIDTKQQPVTFVKTQIIFNPQQVQLTKEVELSGVLKNTISRTSMERSNRTGIINLVVGVSKSSDTPKGVLKLATLYFKPVGSQPSTGSLRVIYDKTQVVNLDAQALVIETKDASLALNQPVASPETSPIASPSNPPTSDLAISKVVMVNADTGQDMQTIDTSQTLTTNILALPLYSFRFEPSSEAVKSVKYVQTADYRPAPITHIDNSQPYSAVGYGWGKYFPWDVGVGKYDITVTPYDQPKAEGKAGTPLHFKVHVIAEKEEVKPILKVSKVVMVRTPDGQEIQTLDTSKPITLSIGAYPKYTLRYETNIPAGSVKHVQTADYRPAPISHIDNNAPYSAVGYGWGQYYPWDVGVGEYTLTITPYTQAGGQGEAGEALEMKIKVVD